ncbi:MAG: tetratricopeptide repeat protein [Planctomycetaceae bacterium]
MNSWKVTVFIGVTASLAAYSLFPREDPTDVFNRGVLAFDQGDLITLHKCETELQGRAGFVSQHALLNGLRSLLANAPANAIRRFELAATDDATRERAYLHTGEALYRLGRPAEAELPLLMAQEINGNNPEIHRWLASVYYDLGAMDPALVQLDQVIALSASDFRASRLKGLILNDFERYQEAVEAYHQALLQIPSDNPVRGEILLELAGCYLKLLEFDSAKQLLTECEQTASVLAMLAECHYTAGDSEAGTSYAKAALAQDPDSFSALMILGSIALAGRDSEAALTYLKRAADQMPTDHLVHLRLSQAYQIIGDQEQATREAELGSHFREQRLKFAKLHEAAMNDTVNAELRYQLGVTALELGRPEIARQWLRVALSIDPHHQLAKTTLAALSRDLEGR